MNLSAKFIEFSIMLIDRIGYLGVSFILIIDNAGVPIPSEGVLALSGAAAKVGQMNIWIVLLLGVVMQTLGSCLAYWIGHAGGGPLVRKYGKYLLISAHDYDKTMAWFDKNGAKAIFISRFTPVVRTFMGFVAGTAKMSFKSFLVQTALGSTVWTIFWVGFGYAVGESWRKYYDVLHYLDYLVIAAIIYFVYRFVRRKLAEQKKLQKKSQSKSV